MQTCTHEHASLCALAAQHKQAGEEGTDIQLSEEEIFKPFCFSVHEGEIVLGLKKMGACKICAKIEGDRKGGKWVRKGVKLRERHRGTCCMRFEWDETGGKVDRN